MHDRDELCSELGLHITGNMFDCRGDGVPGGEQGIYNNIEAFHLEVGFIQCLKWASIIEVMVERDGEVGVCDGGD